MLNNDLLIIVYLLIITIIIILLFYFEIIQAPSWIHNFLFNKQAKGSEGKTPLCPFFWDSEIDPKTKQKICLEPCPAGPNLIKSLTTCQYDGCDSQTSLEWKGICWAKCEEGRVFKPPEIVDGIPNYKLNPRCVDPCPPGYVEVNDQCQLPGLRVKYEKFPPTLLPKRFFDNINNKNPKKPKNPNNPNIFVPHGTVYKCGNKEAKLIRNPNYDIGVSDAKNWVCDSTSVKPKWGCFNAAEKAGYHLIKDRKGEQYCGKCPEGYLEDLNNNQDLPCRPGSFPATGRLATRLYPKIRNFFRRKLF